jgi:hypothetical protein
LHCAAEYTWNFTNYLHFIGQKEKDGNRIKY